VTSCDVEAGIFLQGATEHVHGISSGLLSNTAIRAGEIVASVANQGLTHGRLAGVAAIAAERG
jgi:L-ornithine N5-oxygenase